MFYRLAINSRRENLCNVHDSRGSLTFSTAPYGSCDTQPMGRFCGAANRTNRPPMDKSPERETFTSNFTEICFTFLYIFLKARRTSVSRFFFQQHFVISRKRFNVGRASERASGSSRFFFLLIFIFARSPLPSFFLCLFESQKKENFTKYRARGDRAVSFSEIKRIDLCVFTILSISREKSFFYSAKSARRERKIFSSLSVDMIN